MNNAIARINTCVNNALPKAFKTIIWLLKIILPISLGVSLLQYWGIIATLSVYLTPLFSLVGLPGESAIVFITSIFMALYAPIAIITTLPLEMREITILALMCLISHNLIVETAVQKKTGSSAFIMFSLRIISSFVTAFVLNKILPMNMGHEKIVQAGVSYTDMGSMLLGWLKSSGWLILKISLIITGLMILQNILKEFNILDMLSKIFAPFMKIMGLPKNCSFLWFVAQILGLTYGSAVMIESVENKEISPHDADLLNYHIAVNHSLLEDTLLFAAIGVPVLWMIIPRFVLAVIILWGVHGIRALRRQFSHPEAEIV
jgi:hypothetical protein